MGHAQPHKFQSTGVCLAVESTDPPLESPFGWTDSNYTSGEKAGGTPGLLAGGGVGRGLGRGLVQARLGPLTLLKRS